MALRDLVDRVDGREKTLTVRAPTPSLADDLRSRYAFHNVAVAYEPAPTVRVTLSAAGEVVAAAEGDAARRVADGDDPFREHLEQATFTSYDAAQMLAATREIEDRAWRIGEGALHAGFQRYSLFEDQVDVYRRLARSDLAVHVYASADIEPPDGPFVAHRTADPDVTDLWFVAYDGGGRPDQRCALVAAERGADEYYGFLTYDPDLVADVFAELPADAPVA